MGRICRFVSFLSGERRDTRVEQWKREILAGPRLNLRADSIRGINIDRPRDRRRENVPRSITPTVIYELDAISVFEARG